MFLGTLSDNSRDMSSKGRAAFGQRHKAAKLNDAAVREIRSRYAAGGVTQTILAHEYGVSQSLISLLVKGETWRHVS